MDSRFEAAGDEGELLFVTPSGRVATRPIADDSPLDALTRQALRAF